MNGKRLAMTCIIAALSLVAVVFAAWMKPLVSYEPHQVSKSEHRSCVVPTSSTLFLSEIKPRTIGFTGGSTASVFAAPLLHFQYKSSKKVDRQECPTASEPQPLWLLNRSLLI